MNVNCLAVINDTVGALMSCAHDDRNCAIGLILGKLLLKVEIIQ
jgi:hexokinase